MHSIVKQGGTSKRTGMHCRTANRPRQQVGAKRALAAARQRHAAYRRFAGTIQCRSYASYYSYTSRDSVPHGLLRWADMIQQQQVVRAWHRRCSMITYKAMMCTAETYRTFHQIPSFAKVVFSYFVNKTSQLSPSVFTLEKYNKKHTFANTLN